MYTMATNFPNNRALSDSAVCHRECSDMTSTVCNLAGEPAAEPAAEPPAAEPAAEPAGGGGDEEDPCPAEGGACFADGACIGALPGEDGDMTACFANELCGAFLQCHMDADPGGGGPPECVAAQLADCGEDFGKSSTIPQSLACYPHSDTSCELAFAGCHLALICSDGLDRSSCSDEENAVIDEVAAMECDADGGGGPPACIAEQWAGVESDEEAAGALLCGGLLNRTTCSDDENAVIDEAIASMCGGGGGGNCRSLHCPVFFWFCD